MSQSTQVVIEVSGDLVEVKQFITDLEGVVESLEDRFPNCSATINPPMYRVTPVPPPNAIDTATPEELFKLVTALDADLNEALTVESKQMRNKRGIEVHGKLERCKNRLDELEKDGRTAETQPASDILLSTTRKLLSEIFGIKP